MFFRFEDLVKLEDCTVASMGLIMLRIFNDLHICNLDYFVVDLIVLFKRNNTFLSVLIGLEEGIKYSSFLFWINILSLRLHKTCRGSI